MFSIKIPFLVSFRHSNLELGKTRDPGLIISLLLAPNHLTHIELHGRAIFFGLLNSTSLAPE